MDFRFTDEEEKLRQEVIDFLREKVTSEVVAEQQPLYRQFNQWAPLTSGIIREMGERGWLIPNWPKKYGGLGMSSTATFIVHDEMAYFHLPDIFMGALWAGPTLMKYGSEELKDEFLLPLARGEVEFAVSYTEPEAGCDLARCRERVGRDFSTQFLGQFGGVLQIALRQENDEFFSAPARQHVTAPHPPLDLLCKLL